MGTWKKDTNCRRWRIEVRYCSHDETLSPSQWPTSFPAPTNVLRVMTMGRLSGRRFSMLFRLAALIMEPYLADVRYRRKSRQLETYMLWVSYSVHSPSWIKSVSAVLLLKGPKWLLILYDGLRRSLPGSPFFVPPF